MGVPQKNVEVFRNHDVIEVFISQYDKKFNKAEDNDDDDEDDEKSNTKATGSKTQARNSKGTKRKSEADASIYLEQKDFNNIAQKDSEDLSFDVVLPKSNKRSKRESPQQVKTEE